MTNVTFQRRVRLRIAQVLAEMSAGLVEREVPIRLALLGAIAGEHVLFVGPPGTAKSEIARRLKAAFRDARFFERLMTRFSVPEELFGPLSLKALEADEYRRLIDGYLPTAEIVFLDEVFKANSAILNSLLGVLNERVFDNGRERIALPLISLVGASNEIPTSEELLALYDRFLVRYQLEAVSSRGFIDLLQVGSEIAGVQTHLSAKLVDKIRQEAARVRISSCVRHLLHALRDWLQSKDLYVSDRRWLKIQRLLRVAAYTEGRMVVLWQDCWLLGHCVWSRPEQYHLVTEWLEAQLGDMVRDEPERYARLVTSIEALAAAPAVHKVHRRDAAGRPLYVSETGALVTRHDGKRFLEDSEGNPLYLPPGGGTQGVTAAELFSEFAHDIDAYDEYLSDPNHRLYERIELAPALEAIAGQATQDRGEQLHELAADLGDYLAAVAEQARDAHETAPLWLPADRTRSLVRAMAESSAKLAELVPRLRHSTFILEHER
jgi:MoxR-like ATPase